MRRNRAARTFSSALLAVVLIIFLLQWQGGPPIRVADGATEDRQVTAIVQLEGEPLSRILSKKPQAPGKPGFDDESRREGHRESQSPSAADGPAVAQHRQTLEAQQAEFERNVARIIPEARVRARFDTVMNGVAVTLPARKLSLLNQLPDVKSVSLTQKFRPVLDVSVPLIGAPAVWNLPGIGGVGNAGLGKKIAIIDTGIDQTHPFLTDPSLVPPALPPGRSPGNAGFITNKVIVAKEYPPPGVTFPDGPADVNGHGTHVAGIAAGVSGYVPFSGVAPKAFLMNYNVFGPYGTADAAEIVKAIEDAVKDGADVVNLSLGGAPSGLADDPLVAAVRNGIEMRRVFVIAAGNNGPGAGSILSPGVTPEAITVGATTKLDALASFSSRGPSVDMSIKPDVVAPGEDISSSVSISSPLPGPFYRLSGTSMAAPHVAGAAALLLQLHPSWTPSQVKSALVNTAVFTATDSLSTTSAMARGGGRIDLAAAANPGITIDPPSFSFGVGATKPSGFAATKEFAIRADAGGDGMWSIDVTQTATTSGLSVSLSTPSLALAAGGTGAFSLTLSADSDTAPGDYEGYVTLRKDGKSLHIPYWVRLVPYKVLLLPIYKNASSPP